MCRCGAVKAFARHLEAQQKGEGLYRHRPARSASSMIVLHQLLPACGAEAAAQTLWYLPSVETSMCVERRTDCHARDCERDTRTHTARSTALGG